MSIVRKNKRICGVEGKFMDNIYDGDYFWMGMIYYHVEKKY